jgi:molecular chaperone DnaK (HSP70)
MPAGIPKFQVDFSIDANGILTVSAQEERSQVKMKVSLAPHRGLSEERIEDMKKEAVSHSTEDLMAVRAINIAGEARVVLSATRKAFQGIESSLPDNVSPQQFEEMKKAADELEKYLDTNDTVMIELAHERLNELTVPLADQLISNVVQKIDAREI